MPSMRNCVDLLGIQDWVMGDYCRLSYLDLVVRYSYRNYTRRSFGSFHTYGQWKNTHRQQAGRNQYLD